MISKSIIVPLVGYYIFKITSHPIIMVTVKYILHESHYREINH